MPLPKGPQLRVTVPSGHVQEPLRDDLCAQVHRLSQAVAHVPVAEQVWEVKP